MNTKPPKMTKEQKAEQNRGSRFAKAIPAYAYHPQKKSPSRRDLIRLNAPEAIAQAKKHRAYCQSQGAARV